MRLTIGLRKQKTHLASKREREKDSERDRERDRERERGREGES